MSDSDLMVSFVQAELSKLADPAKAMPMAAYMKTEMPFYGVPKPGRLPIARAVKVKFPPIDAEDYRHKVLSLWGLPHREEKYLAIGYAWTFRKHVVFPQVDLFERMIVEGAWWDFVDELASPIVGKVVLEDRLVMRPVLESWVDGPNMWLRRTAILCQNRHKGQTDQAMLFDFCLSRSDEKEFFIRKAIGWALREYARTRPDEVKRFLVEHGDKLSGLSRREAAKHL
ncbi:MAG TPA: DNA alkylation repair protein [Acidimicrobiia bacterium]|nr:DNA alkylation repair protein [Acidimicrobiia bacterium]